MITKINKSFVTAEEKNNLYKAGFRYIVEGDYRTLGTIDPWSGMPDTTNNIYAFTDKTEAEAFAITQIWVFNPNVHAEVKELPKHTRTWAEIEEEEVKKKAERKAKKEANEAKKATEAGMTIEEYRKDKAKKATITRYKKETKKMKKEIEEMKKEIERMEKYIKENE